MNTFFICLNDSIYIQLLFKLSTRSLAKLSIFGTYCVGIGSLTCGVNEGVIKSLTKKNQINSCEFNRHTTYVVDRHRRCP